MLRSVARRGLALAPASQVAHSAIVWRPMSAAASASGAAASSTAAVVADAIAALVAERKPCRPGRFQTVCDSLRGPEDLEALRRTMPLFLVNSGLSEDHMCRTVHAMSRAAGEDGLRAALEMVERRQLGMRPHTATIKAIVQEARRLKQPGIAARAVGVLKRDAKLSTPVVDEAMSCFNEANDAARAMKLFAAASTSNTRLGRHAVEALLKVNVGRAENFAAALEYARANNLVTDRVKAIEAEHAAAPPVADEAAVPEAEK